MQTFRALLLLSTLGLPISAFSFPDRFSAEYVLQSQGTTVGRTQLELTTAANGQYVYEKRSASAGIFSLFRKDTVVERSEGQNQEGKLRPLAYSYKRTSRKRNRDVSIKFDWHSRNVRTTVNGEPWKMSLPDGTLDKLIYSLAMMRDLARGERNLQYTVADGGTLKTYYIEPLGEEQIETALGSMHTVKLRRFRNRKKRETILWCAPTLSFLPVKMEHREKDHTLVFLIQTADGFDAMEIASDRR